MAEPSLTDAELIARVVVQDDRHAFSELVRRHQSAVRATLRRLTAGNHALADDIAQETFMLAFRNLRSFRQESKFSTWLYRIATNAYLADARRRKEELLGDRDADVADVPHITLKSIARNTSLDPIFAKHEPILLARLQELNQALEEVALELRRIFAGKLALKQKRDGRKSITEADRSAGNCPRAPGKSGKSRLTPIRLAASAPGGAYRLSYGVAGEDGRSQCLHRGQRRTGRTGR